MTIAKRLALLSAIPLVALFALGPFLASQFAKIETQSRFVAGLQIDSLAAVGDISRHFGEERVALRNYLVAKDKTEQARSAAHLRENEAELTRLLARYGDSLISNDAGPEVVHRLSGSKPRMGR